MTRVTVSRALLDWHRRPRERSKAELQAGEDAAPQLAGVVGLTGHRMTLDLTNPRVGPMLLRICDDALADQELHEAKRVQIEVTRRQIDAAINGGADG